MLLAESQTRLSRARRVSDFAARSPQPAGLFIGDNVQASDVTPNCATPQGNGILILSRGAAVDCHSRKFQEAQYLFMEIESRVCPPRLFPIFLRCFVLPGIFSGMPPHPQRSALPKAFLPPSLLHNYWRFPSDSRLDFCFASTGN